RLILLVFRCSANLFLNLRSGACASARRYGLMSARSIPSPLNNRFLRSRRALNRLALPHAFSISLRCFAATIALAALVFSGQNAWAQQSSTADLPSYQRSPSNAVWSGSGASAPSSIWAWFQGNDAADGDDVNPNKIRKAAGASGGST